MRRLGLGLLVLFLVSVLVFAATQALPTDPARSILGRTATPASLKALREQLGLNKPVIQQYTDWLTGLLHGDLGVSLAAREPVATYLHDRLINSAFLVFLAGIISIPISIAIGAYAALRRDGVFDTTSSVGTLLLAALPEFVLGVTLVVVFATTVFPHLLPGVSYIAPGSRPWDQMEEMILPTLTLVLAVTPYVARIMRVSMIEVLESDYVEMARLKGVPERLVIIAPRAAERPRSDVPGDRHQPGVPGRRRDRRRVRLQLRRDRAGAAGRRLDPGPAGGAGARDADRRPLRRPEPAGGHRHDPRDAEAADAPVSVAEVAAFSPEPDVVVARAPAGAVFRTALRMWRTRIGLLLVVILVLVAIVGPLFAPFSPTDFVGVAPNSPPGGKALFGTDHIGQDVWSRFLWGGREILVMAVLATVIGLVFGSAIGLTAAYARNALDDVLMRAMDVILAFPQIMLALVVIATVGPQAWLLVAAVGLTTMPRVARVTRERRSRSSSATSSPLPRRSACRAPGSSCARCCPTSSRRCSSRRTYA